MIILKGITLFDLQALLTYMYHGEVRICEKDIPRLLEAARFLEVRGLTTAQHCEKVHTFFLNIRTIQKLTSNWPVKNIQIQRKIVYCI